MDNLPAVVIADADTASLRRLAREACAAGFTIAAAASDGLEALAAVRREKPSVLVCSLLLPSLDGLALVRLARDACPGLRTMLICGFLSRDVYDECTRLGVDCVLTAPLADGALAAVLSALPRRAQRRFRSLDAVISALLRELGVPVNFKGYRYLREAVRLVLQDGGYVRAVTTRLYPEVAARFGATGSQVERSIRNAVAAAHSEPTERMAELFPAKRRPTNSEFIALLAELLSFGDEYLAY